MRSPGCIVEVNMKKNDYKTFEAGLIYVFLFFAFFLILHQLVFWGKLFELEEIHHETWIIMFLFAAFIIFVLKRCRGNK
jgi:hypothetical protein